MSKTGLEGGRANGNSFDSTVTFLNNIINLNLIVQSCSSEFLLLLNGVSLSQYHWKFLFLFY